MIETLHQRTARVLLLGLNQLSDGLIALQIGSRLTYLGIEHLTLGRQAVTLLNQRVDLLATFQHTLNLRELSAI